MCERNVTFVRFRIQNAGVAVMAHWDVLEKPEQTARLFVRQYGQLAVFHASICGFSKARCGRFNRELFWAQVVRSAREILNSSRVVPASRKVAVLAPASESEVRQGYARRVGPVSDRHAQLKDGASHSHGDLIRSFASPGYATQVRLPQRPIVRSGRGRFSSI